VRALAASDVQVLGAVADLRPLYERARVFVAPIRFGAGLPHKVHEAAAHGLPVVATSLLCQQLGWRDGQELAAADSPERFADAIIRLHRDAAAWRAQRDHALRRVAADCSPVAFARAIEEALRVG
jgi:glycosyltransferase involved in cell wall biosynthesis